MARLLAWGFGVAATVLVGWSGYLASATGHGASSLLLEQSDRNMGELTTGDHLIMIRIRNPIPRYGEVTFQQKA